MFFPSLPNPVCRLDKCFFPSFLPPSYTYSQTHTTRHHTPHKHTTQCLPRACKRREYPELSQCRQNGSTSNSGAVVALRVMRFLRCFSQYSLCTVSMVVTVPSVATVVFSRFHLSTSVVLHSDRPSSCGSFWLSIKSICVIEHFCIFFLQILFCFVFDVFFEFSSFIFSFSTSFFEKFS